MRKFDFAKLFKKHWIHLLAIGLFILTTILYFQPQFTGHRLKQQDITQFKGMSNEINHFRAENDSEPLWTNSMFGGMPTYQISTWYSGNLFHRVNNVIQLWMASPAGYFFVYLLGFYIMLLCMRVDPKVAIFGAFAFAFSSYYIVILQAGHNTKAASIGLIAPVVGAFFMAFRYNLKWGVLLSALFMGLHLSANHFQITFYMLILLLGLGIVELLRQIKLKNWLRFGKAAGGLIIAYLLALGVNYGNISLTQDYASHTIRGGNDITIQPDGTSSDHIKTSGLDKDYITQWSYGIGESLTLLSPNIKGGSSSALQNSQFSDLLRSKEFRSDARLVAKNNVYWGQQPFTSGPVYLGIIVFFLAVLGMVYLKGPLKWGLAAVTILTLMLSWGKNFMGLTDFFIDYIPFYNKFRAVTIILSIVEFTIPLLAVLFLNFLFKNKEAIKNNIRPFYITTGTLLGLFVLLTFTGLGDGYLTNKENDYVYNIESQVKQQLANEDPARLRKNGIDVNNPQQIQQIIDQQKRQANKQFDALINVRKSIYKSSMGRSILFLLLGAIILFVYFRTSTRKEYIIGGLLIFVLIDLVSVDLNYINNKKSNNRDYDHWVEKSEALFPEHPTKADRQIMEQELAANPALKKKIEQVSVERSGKRKRVNQDELWLEKFQTLGANTNYRVYEPAIGFNSSRASYFHKAINGYHGAKLRRIQNIKNFYINYNNMDVLNMLNVKYFIQQEQARKNPGALGNAWLVRDINVQPTPNKEMLHLGNLFMIKNESNQTLFVNQNNVEADTISGKESVVLFGADSTRLNIQKVMRSGVSSKFVRDANRTTSWVPTTELEKDTMDSFTTLVSVEKISDFTPKTEAIISKDEANELSSLTFSGQGEIKMTSYAPNALKYKVSVSENQFAVFSEMYYPEGWNAYIDGEKVPIHRVDYLLRGIELPKGDYELEMRFEVPKYYTANKIALAGSGLVILLIIGMFINDFLLKKKGKVNESQAET